MPSTWVLAAEDLSGVTADWHNQVSGTAALNIGVFDVTQR
jgi:hypothetical protein